MAKTTPKMSGLGMKQMNLLYRMAKESLVIRVLRCEGGRYETIVLQDQEADNDYEAVPGRILASFVNRGLVNYSGWQPSLSVSIDTFWIKNEVKKRLGIIPGDAISTKSGKQNN